MKATLLLITVLMLFSCGKKNDENRPNNFKEQKRYFTEAVDHFLYANDISAELPKIKSEYQNEEQEKMFSEIEKGLYNGSKIDESFLDFLHPEMVFQFRYSLLDGNRKYMAGLRNDWSEEKAISMQVEGVNQIQEWQRFIKGNSEEINDKLNSKQSFFRTILWISSAKNFFIMLFVGGIISSIFFISIMAVNGISWTLIKPSEKTLRSSFLFLVLLMVGIFLCLQWVAFMTEFTLYYRSSPKVEHPYLYHILGFLLMSIVFKFLTLNFNQIENLNFHNLGFKNLLNTIIGIGILTCISGYFYLLYNQDIIINNPDIFWLNEWIIAKYR